MRQFIKSILATLLALILFFTSIIFVFFLIATIAGQEEKIEVKPKSIIKLDLNREIVEREEPNPFEGFDMFGMEDFGMGLTELKKTLNYAATDSNIAGIYLSVSDIGTGFSSLEDIREMLVDFKRDGKFIIAYSNYYSESSYYIASVADKIFMNPLGSVELNGLNYEMLFFKEMLDSLRIRPELFKVGNFKSAMEPFVLDSMSPANREQIFSFINDIYTRVLKGISVSRNLTFEATKMISDSLVLKQPDDAVKLGLITALKYHDEAEIALTEQLEIESDAKINFIGYHKYKKYAADKGRKFSRNKIVIIHARGAISQGKGDEERIGADSFNRELRDAREDKNVKAIVLRINSPGGDALASDMMWREIQLTRVVKPVIASMSDVAASGGYYMAMGCDKIVARPSTITGSIGVIGLLLNTKGFLKEWLGINVDKVTTSPHADLMSSMKTRSEAEHNFIQQSLDDIYDTFTRKAAQGRNMSQEEIKEIGGGRVWTGEQAKANRLVDLLGGVDVAIDLAAELSGVGEDFEVKHLPVLKDPITKLLTEKMEEIKVSAIKEKLGSAYIYFESIQKLRHMEGMQTIMPFWFEVK